MLEGVFRRLLGRSIPEVPNSPPNLPAEDSEDLLSDDDKVELLDECLLGHSMMIEYVDAAQNESRRRVTILGFVPGENVLMHAKCHERNAFRAFRLDRVKAIIDVRTGEVFEPAQRYFEERFDTNFDSLFATSLEGTTRTGALLKVVNPGIVILAGLAASDGFVHADEIEAILRYCDECLFDVGVQLQPKEVDHIEAQIERAFLSHPKEIEKACRKLVNENGLRRFLRAAREVVDADGVMSAGEIEFINSLEADIQLLAK